LSASPPGGDRRGGARRILPSVAEVAAALARRVSADPPGLYRVSREVVTEELARVKQGLEAAPLEELVARAEERFRALRPEAEIPKQPDLFAQTPPSGPPPLPDRLSTPAEPVLPVAGEFPVEPFAAATSADLGWDRPGGEDSAAMAAPVESARAEPVRDLSEAPVTGAADFQLGEAPEESAPEAGEAREAKEPQDAAARRSLWILSIAAVVVVAAGLFWLVARLLSPPSMTGRGAGATKVELPAPPVLPPAGNSAAAPAPTPVPQPVTRAAIAATPAKPAPPATPQGRVASFVTQDWTGRPPVFIVHFASHQDRSAAAGDAARLASRFGEPARAVEVDLGAKGVWYRVVVGEFPTAEKAKAFHAALAAKKTPGMGFVYEMRGAR
jgi:hypothetical protein